MSNLMIRVSEKDLEGMPADLATTIRSRRYPAAQDDASVRLVDPLKAADIAGQVLAEKSAFSSPRLSPLEMAGSELDGKIRELDRDWNPGRDWKGVLFSPSFPAAGNISFSVFVKIMLEERLSRSSDPKSEKFRDHRQILEGMEQRFSPLTFLSMFGNIANTENPLDKGKKLPEEVGAARTMLWLASTKLFQFEDPKDARRLPILQRIWDECRARATA